MPKRIAILGGGESGTGAAILAQKQGFDVFLSDSRTLKPDYKSKLSSCNISFEEGMHTPDQILNADEIIKSPGIPDDIPLLVKASEKSIPVVSEIEFASRYTNARKICITGSNGKSTTTLLIYETLKAAGKNVGLAGNIGKSFAWQVSENDFDTYVLEISSFQLDGMVNFRADVALLLNITPDHLDRYDNQFSNYINSKFRIIRNQTRHDCFIYNADDKVITDKLSKHESDAECFPFSIKNELNQMGGWVKQNNPIFEQNQIIINTKNDLFSMHIRDLALQGRHNVQNSLAAGIAVKIEDLRNEEIRKSFGQFKNIEHRLEFVIKIRGVEYINDSKATNINSVWYALECMKKPVVWIAGGEDKGNDYSELADLVKSKVKAIVCLGLKNQKIVNTFSEIVPVIVETHSAPEAVRAAYKLSAPGDVVLLSPGCASFDLFKNFEDRGRQFKQAVLEL